MLLSLRELVFEAAEANPDIGPLTETLKWGEPSYLTDKTGSGTTLRMDWKAKSPDQVGLYVNCQTTLVDSFRGLFPELRFEGKRAVLFDLREPLPRDTVRLCIDMVLTYHRRKRQAGV